MKHVIEDSIHILQNPGILAIRFHPVLYLATYSPWISEKKVLRLQYVGNTCYGHIDRAVVYNSVERLLYTDFFLN